MNIIIETTFDDKYLTIVSAIREKFKLPLKSLESLTQSRESDFTRSTLTSRSKASLNLTRVQFYKQLSARQPSNYVPIVNPFNIVTDEAILKKKSKGIEKVLNNSQSQHNQLMRSIDGDTKSLVGDRSEIGTNTSRPPTADAVKRSIDGKRNLPGKITPLPQAQTQNYNMLNITQKTNVPYVEKMKKSINYKYLSSQSDEPVQSPRQKKDKPAPLPKKKEKRLNLIITEEEIVNIPIETIPIKVRTPRDGHPSFIKRIGFSPRIGLPRNKPDNKRKQKKKGEEGSTYQYSPRNVHTAQHNKEKQEDKVSSPRASSEARVRTAPLNRKNSEQSLLQVKRPKTGNGKNTRKKTSGEKDTLIEGVLDAWGGSGFDDFPDDPMIVTDWTLPEITADECNELDLKTSETDNIRTKTQEEDCEE